MKLIPLFFLTILMFSCSSDSDSNDENNSGTTAGGPSGDPVTITTNLANISTAIANSIPKFENQVGLVQKRKSKNHPSLTTATNFITPAVWAGEAEIFPPGGSVQNVATELQYDGADIPNLVNYRDYMKMALDADFRRATNDGDGDEEGYRPTIFGQIDSLVEIMTYISQAGFTLDSSGIPESGDQVGSLTRGDQTITIAAKIADTTTNTYYDKSMRVLGYADLNSNGAHDTDEPVMVDVLLWIRSTTTQLNMLQVDMGDHFPEGEGENESGDGNIDTVYISAIHWNIETGAIRFEHTQDVNDSESTGLLETFRYLSEGDGGKVWLYQLSGKAVATEAEYLQYSLYTPSPTGTEGTISLRHARAGGDLYLGNLCATFATGVGAEGEELPDDENPGSGGTCAGQVSDSLNTKNGVMGFAFGLRANTTITETASDKGFPSETYADWNTSDEGLAAWITAGESVSASFDNRDKFISRFGAAP